jgi:hypothetical protein
MAIGITIAVGYEQAASIFFNPFFQLFLFPFSQVKLILFWAVDISVKKRPGEIPGLFLEEEEEKIITNRPCWCRLSS